MVEVIGTGEFQEWFDGLSDKDSDAVTAIIDLLEQMGVALPFPYSSAIRGAKIALRELRIQSGGKPLRVFYTFDPRRNAVVLTGGDKTGDSNFYEQKVRESERIYADYLKETGQ